MPEGVREQVEQDALHLVRGAAGDRVPVEPRLEGHALRLGLRLEPAQAGLDERRYGGVLRLDRERAGVDSGELEEVVDERSERLHLLPHRGQVAIGLGDPVLDRLEHRLERCKRRAQVVARPRDELPPGVEELVEVDGHLVEGARELVQLGGPLLGRPRAQVPAGDGRRRGP